MKINVVLKVSAVDMVNSVKVAIDHEGITRDQALFFLVSAKTGLAIFECAMEACPDEFLPDDKLIPLFGNIFMVRLAEKHNIDFKSILKSVLPIHEKALQELKDTLQSDGLIPPGMTDSPIFIRPPARN